MIMSSKEEILAAIRKNTGKKYDYPQTAIDAIHYPDPVAQFKTICAAVGGEAVVLEPGQDINKLIREKFPDAKRIASVLPEITCATYNPDDEAEPKDLNGTDLAVVRGELAVAENGACWIPQTVKHKAVYFIAEALVIIVPKTELVHNMHEAYAKVKTMPYKFGVFISGPSKTADIEQALVMGAHGARKALVVLV